MLRKAIPRILIYKYSRILESDRTVAKDARVVVERGSIRQSLV